VQGCLAGASRPQHQFEQSTLSVFALQHRISKKAIMDLASINAELYTETVGGEKNKMWGRLIRSKLTLTIVTGCGDDIEHFSMLLELVNSIGSQEKSGSLDDISALGSQDRGCRLVVHDLGMSADQHESLQKGFSRMGGSVQLEKVDWSKYPPHIQPQYENEGWKAVVMANTMEKYGGLLVWLDSNQGFLLKKPLDRIREYLLDQGFVSPRHPVETVEEFTAPSTMSRFEDKSFQFKDDLPLLSASIFGFDSANASVIGGVFRPFLECCLEATCLSPPGATPETHRYASSVLALASYRFKMPYPPKRNDLSITDHSDTKGVVEMDVRGVEQVKRVCAYETDSLEFTIATSIPRKIGASSSVDVHDELIQLGYWVHSFQKMPVTRLLVYDIGLPFAEGEALREHFEEESMKDKESGDKRVVPEVRYFDFEGFPDHLRTTQGFKAVILNELINEYGGMVLYLGTDWTPTAKVSNGNVNQMGFIKEILACDGFVSTHSGGTIKERVSSAMLDLFDVDGETRAQQPLNTEVIGFNAGNEFVVEGIMNPWLECCMQTGCIGEPGQNRKNHQYEQSALTLIAYQHGVQVPMPSKAELALESIKLSCAGGDPNAMLSFVTGVPTFKEPAREELETLRTWMSVLQALGNTRVVIFDMGLQPEDREYLNSNTAGLNVVLRDFKMSKYESGTKIPVPNMIETGCYKPAILKEVVEEFGEMVLWLDLDTTPIPLTSRGNPNPMTFMRDTLSCDGFVSTHSGGSVLERTHLAMIAHFNVDKATRALQPLNSGLVGLNGRKRDVIEGILEPWLACCLNARCIQEPGLSRKNHQYEQSALTVVAYKFGISVPQPSKKKLGVVTAARQG